MLKAIETLDKWPCLIDVHAEDMLHIKQILAVHTLEVKKKPLLKYVHVIVDVYLHVRHAGTM